MKRLSNKYIRDNLDQSIRSLYRKMFPNFEYQQHLRRIPSNPNVVVYSSVPSVDKFLNQIFPTYRYLKTEPSNDSDESMNKFMIQKILGRSEQPKIEESGGTILKGYPFNQNQALLLDQAVQGVNLALHIKGTQSAQSYKSLLDYYRERGTLLQIDYLEEVSKQQLQKIQTKILTSMKRTA